MVLLTMIARIADGLPLAATMQEDEQVAFEAVVLIISCVYDIAFFFVVVVV
jgi:hypothetical protein